MGRRGKRLLLTVVLLTVGGVVVWRLLLFPTTPQYALDQILNSARQRDYAALYDHIQWAEEVRPLIPNAQNLRDVLERYPEVFPQWSSWRVLHTERQNDAAVCTVRGTSPALPESTRTFPMLRVRGEWCLNGQFVLQGLQERQQAEKTP